LTEATTDETATNDEQEQEPDAWASQSPTTAISGTFEDLFFGGTLDAQRQETGSNFGIILGDARVDHGGFYRNDEKPEGETTATIVGEGDSRSSDYRIADEDDSSTTLVSGTLVTDENSANQYSEVSESDEDEILLWENGLAGQFVGQALDRHGLPWARWKAAPFDHGEAASGYLVKGLIHIPTATDSEGNRWTEGQDCSRGEIVQSGFPPRVIRPAYPRPDLQGERITIVVRRPAGGGNYHIGNVFRTAEIPGDDADPFDDEGDLKEGIWEEAVVNPRFDQDFDEFVVENNVPFSPYTGEGYQDKPANAIDPNDAEEVTGLTVDNETEQETDDEDSGSSYSDVDDFVGNLVTTMESQAAGRSPDGFDGNPPAWETTDADDYDSGLEKVVDQHLGNPDDYDMRDIREKVYQQHKSLDVSDLPPETDQ